MFSCCRTNPKSSSTKSAKKDKQKNGDKQESNKASDTKLIIPTITIENGKTIDNLNDHNAYDAEIEEAVSATTVNSNSNGNIVNNIGDDIAVAFVDNIKNNENVKTTASTETVVAADIAAQKLTDSDTSFIVNSEQSNKQNKTSPNSSTHESFIGAINQTNERQTIIAKTTIVTNEYTTGITEVQQKVHEEDGRENQNSNQRLTESVEKCEQKKQRNDKQQHKHIGHTTETTTMEQNTHDFHPKSCLSRHNSTHTSIRKKVNISTHAEIFELDPLPPPSCDHASLGDDDDVFSDSLPAPKRGSMCAPYIEPNKKIQEKVTFAHGLPEWFNNERIQDVGFIEPPVTPVGRDELELKRQRLYTDLLRAAHAAVDHSVRFPTAIAVNTFTYDDAAIESRKGAGCKDCDPDLKPSVTENLEHLVNRLEKLVERLECSVSARELEIANRTFDTVLEKKSESFDLETTNLPPVPVELFSQQLTQNAENLNQRIERIEITLNKINDLHSSSISGASLTHNSELHREDSLENIPTVLDDYELPTILEVPLPPPPNMSVLGFKDIINGPLRQYMTLSAAVGGDVAKHAELVTMAFNAQLQYVTLVSQCAKPSQDKQMDLLKPTSVQISAIQDYREKNRLSEYFNHLSAISESIPALGWVCIVPAPASHVKEMNDAGQFFINRVLKEWKEKGVTHVEWARAWIQTLTELQFYVKQYHTTGLVWSGKGNAPANGAATSLPLMGDCPPPPTPPAFDLVAMLHYGDERSALFAQINQGEDITKNLKKVTADMQSYKNLTLHTGPALIKSPIQFGSLAGIATTPAEVKEPVFTRDGKKWIIEYQKQNIGLLVENAEMNNVVYMFKCEGSTLTVKGKVNNIVMDSCKKCSLLFDSVVASIEFVNCQSVQMQTLAFVPTISIDKTDGCQMYLSKESLEVEIVSSKSSEMNVMLPKANGDYTELALPEQFKTTIEGKTLKTVCIDSLG